MKAKFYYFLSLAKKYFSSEYLFKSQPVLNIQKKLLIILIILAGAAILIKVFSLFIYKNDSVRQKFANLIFSWLLTVSLIGLFFWFGSWQQISLFSVNFWWYVVVLLFFVWGVIILIYRVEKYPKELTAAEDRKRKAKYLPKPKKK